MEIGSFKTTTNTTPKKPMTQMEIGSCKTTTTKTKTYNTIKFLITNNKKNLPDSENLNSLPTTSSLINSFKTILIIR